MKELSTKVTRVQKLFNKACEIVPSLKEHGEIKKAFCGLRPASLSGGAYMDKIPDCENAFLCTGHGGIGICMAPIASQVMKEKLLA